MGSKAAKQKPNTSPATARKPTPMAPERAADPLYSREELARILAEREAWTATELAETLARAPRRQAG